jgi:hypothetical protein
MVEAVAGQRIVPTQKTASHAAIDPVEIDPVEDRDFTGIEHLRTSKPSHDNSPKSRLLAIYRLVNTYQVFPPHVFSDLRHFLSVAHIAVASF